MFSWEIYEFFRSNHRGCFMKKAVFKHFAIFTRKLRVCNFIKNRLQHRCFLLNVAKILVTSISKNICSLSSCFCSDSFIKSRYFINRLQTIKLLTVKSKFVNLCFISRRWIMLREKFFQDLATLVIHVK